MPDHKLIIAIDGYSSCGKSTFAKMLAKHLKYAYIDTGAMYRAVTLFALQNNMICGNGIDVNSLQSKLGKIDIRFIRNTETGANETTLNGENVEEAIRSLEVSSRVSEVSSYKFVREQMVELQRKMAIGGGVVMDGRDIGTVVFPNADLKLFMTADPEIRAQRRYDELVAKGQTVDFNDIRENLIKRDLLDSTREESPLRQADDALVLDNSHMTPEEQLIWVEDKMKKLLSK
jgi:cytidylate kinase